MTMKEEFTAIDMATAAADGFRAGQRAAQSAGVPDGLFLADALLMWNRRHDNPPIHVGYEYGVADALLQMLAAPTVKAEQVQCAFCDDTGQIQGTDCGRCAPSLPAAGSAVEEVDLFNEWFGREVWTDGCYGNPDILRRQLWPCWQARAALSAQQSAPERVSVPVELMERLIDPYRREPRSIHLHNEDCQELRALLASHGRGEA